MPRKLSDYIPGLKGADPVTVDVAVDLGDILDPNGNEILEFDSVTSAVNNIGVQNAATGGFPTIYAAGEADTGIDFENSEGEEILKLDSIASAVNELTIKNAAASSEPEILASGDDTDIDIKLTPKGAGFVDVNGPLRYKREIVDTGGVYATPIVLTAAQSGRVILVDDAAGLDFTLPAIAAAQIGTHFTFVVTVTITSNNFRVTAGAGDLLFGSLWIADFDTANTGTYFTADGTDDLVLTMNGSTTGGKKGTWVEFIATSATQWFVKGTAFGDGSLATPFS